MLIFPKGYSQNPGSLSNLIKALVAAGKKISTIINAVRESFKGIKESTIQKLTDYWRGARNAATSFQNAPWEDVVSKHLQSSYKANLQSVQIGYTVEFFDPNLDDYRPWGGYIDVKPGDSKNMVINKILAVVSGKLVQFYEYKTLSKKELTALANAIEFKSLEGK